MFTLIFLYCFFSIMVLVFLLHFEHTWTLNKINLQEAALLLIYTLGSFISFGYIIYRLATGSVDIAKDKVVDDSEDSGC